MVGNTPNHRIYCNDENNQIRMRIDSEQLNMSPGTPPPRPVQCLDLMANSEWLLGPGVRVPDPTEMDTIIQHSIHCEWRFHKLERKNKFC